MVKSLLSIILIVSFLQSKSFQKQCLSCHAKLPLSFDKFYMQYLIRFSSEYYIKEAMFNYLKEPMRGQSVMDKSVIERLGVMPKPQLTDVALKALIEEYVKLYDVKRKLH